MSTIRVLPADIAHELANETAKNEKKGSTSVKTLSLLQKFSSETTLHGIRYLFESESFLIRRVLWLLVIFACTGFCIQQFHSRITRFLTDDQTVDVEIVYVNEQAFPQVTICNNNLFKSTKVLSTGAYLTIEQFFSATSYADEDFIKTLTAIDEQQYQNTGSYINLTQIYISSRHDIETMLVDCSFRGQPCNASDFTMILTDYGPCYQFTANGERLVVNNAGAGTGLTIALNAQQYAYMKGPRYSAGFLMSIQDPREVPKIGGRAINVPVGGEIFIAFDLTTIQLIPPPKGECSNKVLKYYPEYSLSACQLECLTEYVVSHCGCKNNYMPGNTSLCHLPVYFGCSYPYSQNFSLSKEVESCICPPSCEESIYSPLLTYSPTSDFVANSYSATLVDSDLYHDYVKARGVYEFYYNPKQRAQDVAAISKFSPFLLDFSNYVAPYYSPAASINELVDGIMKLISTQSTAAGTATVLSLANTVKLQIQDFISMMHSVDPSFYFGEWARSNMLEVLSESLALNGRFLFFHAFRRDIDETNNGTSLFSLQSNFALLTGNIENNLRQIIQLASVNGLSATIPSLTPMINNMSETLTLMVNSRTAIEPIFQRLVTVGLQDLNEYANQNVPKLSSINFDAAFIRSNFMKVEIFFKDMRYQSIEKKMSDSVTSLICDIGGTFGLCLGASIMSIYEFIDFSLCYMRLRFSA